MPHSLNPTHHGVLIFRPLTLYYDDIILHWDYFSLSFVDFVLQSGLSLSMHPYNLHAYSSNG